MRPDDGRGPAPATIPDSERHLVAARLQEAVGAGTLALDEFIERLDTVYGASTREVLATALDGLPAAPPVNRGRRVKVLGNIFGDERRSGPWRPDASVTAINVFGDVALDLRAAHIETDEVVIRFWSVFGDVELIVPEGVEVDLSGFLIFGDRKVQVAPVARIPGTPRIRLIAFGLFGDAAIRSAPR